MPDIFLQHLHQPMAEKDLGIYTGSLGSSGLRQTFQAQAPPVTCSMTVGKLRKLLKVQFPHLLYGQDYVHFKGHWADEMSYQRA